MTNLNLQPNEAIILESIGVSNGQLMSGYTDELYLTNINIFYVRKNMWGKVKTIEKFPIHQIKVVNSVPQAIMQKNPQSGREELHIYFINGKKTFDFQSSVKKEGMKWINSIHKELTGSYPSYENTSTASQLVGNILGGIDSITQSFGLNLNIQQNQQVENITTKCSGCRASLTGKRGENIRCKYCDTVQTL